MLRTKFDKQAAIKRLLNQQEEQESEDYVREEPTINTNFRQNHSTFSKENNYDIPAEVILSQTTKARKNQEWSEVPQNIQR